MKKTKLLLSLCAIALTGCENNETQQLIDAERASNITEFNYKGHHYIEYSKDAGRSSVACIIHDPDCPCREKNKY